MEDSIQGKTSKQQNLENLSKDDLIAKCKSLITFLKKAKTAKDDAVAEVEKLKGEHAKITLALEDERNKAERENEALQEMVSNLTENKMVIVTKNDSLQRQLQVQLSEVDAMKQIQQSLIEEKDHFLKEIDNLKHYVKKQQQVVDGMKEERTHYLSVHSALKSEKSELSDKIECLEEQLKQIDILKSNCKNLLEEKEISAKRLKAVEEAGESRFKEEKKAMDIIHNEIKNQKSALEDKIKTMLEEKEESIIKTEDLENSIAIKDKLLSEYKSELETSAFKYKELEQSYEQSLSQIKHLKEEANIKVQRQDLCESAETRLEVVNQECAEYKKEADVLHRRIEELEILAQSHIEKSEHELLIDKLQLELNQVTNENNKCQEFYNAVLSNLNLESNESSKDDILGEICKLKFDMAQITLNYEELQVTASNLASLIRQMFCPNFPEVTADSIGTSINLTYINLENKIKQFKDSHFEAICNKCVSDIEKFCHDIDTFENLVLNIKSSETPEIIASLLASNQLLLSYPIVSLTNHLREVIVILSQFLSYNLVPELSRHVELAQTKSETLLKVFLDVCKLNNFYHNENIRLNSTLESQTDQIASQRSEIKSLKDQYNDALKCQNLQEDSIKEIKKQYEDIKIEFDQQQEEVVKSKEELTNLRNQANACEQLNNLNEDLKTKLSSTEDKIKDIITANESLSDELENVEKEKKLLMEQNVVLREEISSLESNLTEKNNLLDDEVEKLGTLTIENESLKSENEPLRSENESLRSENESLLSVNESLKCENKLLKENDIWLRSELSESNESSISNTDKFKEELKTLTDENISLKENISSLKIELKETSDSLGRETEQLNEKLEFFKNENETLSIHITSLESELAKSTETNESSHSELESIKKDFELLKDSNCNLNKTISSLNEELNVSSTAYETIKLKYENITDEFKSINGVNQLLTEKINSLEKAAIESDALNLSQSCNAEKMKEDFESINEDKNALEEKVSLLNEEFKKYSDKNKFLKEEIVKIQEDFQAVKNENESLKEILSSKEKEASKASEMYELINSDSDDLKRKIESLNSTKDSLNEKITSLETKLEDATKLNEAAAQNTVMISEEFDSAVKENEILKNEILSLNIELEKSSKNFDESCRQIREELDVSSKENESLKYRLSALENDLTASVKNKELADDLLKECEDKLEVLVEENKRLKSNVLTLESNVIGCVKSYKSIHDDGKTEIGEETIDNLKGCAEKSVSEDATKSTDDDATSRYKEIISELNEMNQIIRKRGERIYLLEDSVQKKNCDIESLTSQLKEAKNKCEEMEKMRFISTVTEDENCVSDLKERILSLEEENQTIKKNLESEIAHRGASWTSSCPVDAQSDVVSTSTIGKLEESHRLKELEDTFEERYMKLKSVAIKLKKKLAEQTLEMKTLEDAKQKLAAEKDDAMRKGGGLASKNIQVLQGEIDKLQDLLDENKKELKDREKQLLASAQESSDVKSKLAFEQEQNAQLTARIQNLEISLSDQESLCKSLSGQVAALEKRLGLEEEEISRLKEEQKASQDAFEGERKQWGNLAQELEEARQDTKKHSLLDLEMKDYERSIEDLTSQVQGKDEIIYALNDRIENSDSKIQTFTEEISFLKEQIDTETDRAEKLKKTVTEYKTQLSDLRSKEEFSGIEREKDRVAIENLNQELEKHKLAMAELSSQSSQKEAKLRQEKEVAENKVELFQEKVENGEKLLQNLRIELESLHKEHEAYKIRAQSVLRQKAKVPQVSYEELKAERDQLTGELEAAQLKAHQLQPELTAARAELGFLSSEKERLSLQVATLSSEMEKKQTGHLESVAALEKKLTTKVAEYQLIVSNMSSQMEAMNQSFKSQVESQKEKHSREIIELQAKIDECEELIWQLKNAPPSVVSGSSSSGKVKGKQEVSLDGPLHLMSHPMREVSHGAEEHRIDVTNMIREEGEGSEWVDPPNRSPIQQLYNPPSLEQLINSPFPSQQHLDESLSVASAATEYSTKEFAKLESKLSGCEIRIQQLTALLSESEGENAKLVQLSDALKEEIRRASRNENREKHLENNEYIKNVIMKFLNLKTGDEKFRLVPVLKTLLQLSPEEVSNVTFIAKGEDAQNIPQGWGNYLHMWSGK